MSMGYPSQKKLSLHFLEKRNGEDPLTEAQEVRPLCETRHRDLSGRTGAGVAASGQLQHDKTRRLREVRSLFRGQQQI